MPPKIMDYMTSPVIVISPNDTLSYARNLMLKNGISSLIVVDKELPVGVLTSTDFLKTMMRGELMRRPWSEIVVREVMTENPITVKMTYSIVDAARMMIRNQISTLPVIDNDGKLSGIIKRSDLVRAFAENYEGWYKVSDLMDVSPPTISPFAPITAVLDKISEKPYYKVLVLDGERVVGIIAKRDLIFIEPSKFVIGEKYIKRDTLLEKGRTGGVRFYLIPLANDIMSTNLITIYPDSDASDAANQMSKKGIGCLPVISKEDGRALGLITKHEITMALSKM